HELATVRIRGDRKLNMIAGITCNALVDIAGAILATKTYIVIGIALGAAGPLVLRQMEFSSAGIWYDGDGVLLACTPWLAGGIQIGEPEPGEHLVITIGILADSSGTLQRHVY